ncbi:CCHC-type domain-containing protein [Nephila pilipes]|uniref:CCHC-type domain-containing protein n=1 Tax=Nephila pilipes TaxID=299642 RepID=A0A8X6P8L6_NEPPI|nr:CCHC-type domain-containing protein [Nephila pilipes]
MWSGLMSLAYAECPLDIRESLAAQYFVDAIRDEDTQHSTRLMDAKDLKSALAYSVMKYEAARTVSKTSKHVRSLEGEDDSKKKEDKFESLFNRLEKLLNYCITEKKNASRRNPNVTCWQYNRKGHIQRDCQAIKPNQENYAKAVLGGGESCLF